MFDGTGMADELNGTGAHSLALFFKTLPNVNQRD